MGLVEQAAELARQLVEPLGRRWNHVQAVAERAQELSHAVSESDRTTLIAAAWLHDIGYSPRIGLSCFHPLDGARFLRDEDWPDVVVRLVAHHSAARYEAPERDMVAELAEFPFVVSALQDALDTADLPTGRPASDSRSTSVWTKSCVATHPRRPCTDSGSSRARSKLRLSSERPSGSGLAPIGCELIAA